MAIAVHIVVSCFPYCTQLDATFLLLFTSALNRDQQRTHVQKISLDFAITNVCWTQGKGKQTLQLLPLEIYLIIYNWNEKPSHMKSWNFKLLLSITIDNSDMLGWKEVIHRHKKQGWQFHFLPRPNGFIDFI